MKTENRTPGALMGQSLGAYTGGHLAVGGRVEGAAGRRPREKIADVVVVEEALRLAAVTMKPDELSGRQLINRLMPSLYALRKKGFSFNQLTKVLNDAIGGAAKLQVATVKAYYNEFILERQDDCEKNLQETLRVIKQVDELTTKAPKALVADAVQFSQALSASRGGLGNTVASRLLGDGPSTRAALTGGTGQTDVMPPPAAENKRRPPSAAAESPPATGLTTQIEGRGAEAVNSRSAPSQNSMTPSYLPDIDDIPVPSLPSAAAMPGNTKHVDSPTPSEIPSAPTQKQSATPQIQSITSGDTVLVCTTKPTAETTYPANSEYLEGVPQEFFSDALLEHPAIPGLMLTRAQRMYAKRLEYIGEGGEIITEKAAQMSKRIAWRKGQNISEARTSGDFVEMNAALFKKG